MRDYGKIAPSFWTGETGKLLKAAGPEAVIVAMYLMTSPHANMIGLYYLPKLYIAHETGLGVDGAAKGLSACVEAGFCAYDEDAETIFVPRMASYQVAESLSVKDNRRIAVLRELDSVGSSEFADMFRQIYATPFCLEAHRYPSVPHHRFSPSLVRQVVEACGGVCKGCKTPFSGGLKPTIDHVVAKINGGTRDRANLQALCGPCNSRKAVLDRALFWERCGLEATPYEGVSKGSFESAEPLRSQEQEQEQEQDKTLLSESDDSNDDFEQFWTAYPKKQAKQDAAKAFRSAKLKPEQLQTVLQDIKRRGSSPDWQKDGGKFIPLPATYIRGKRWEDAPLAQPMTGAVEYRNPFAGAI